jgi:hypothetical protein
LRKRRHHTVWRYYLSPWTRDGQISCLQAGNAFRTGTINVAVETDFYRLKNLAPRDVEFLVDFILKSPEPNRQLHREWLESVLMVTEIGHRSPVEGRPEPAMSQSIDDAIANFEENVHTAVESGAQNVLEDLWKGQRAFFGTLEGYTDFTLFLCFQYFRTTKIHNSMLEAFRNDEFNMEAAWPVLRHFCAVNVGASFVGRRSQVHLTLLHALDGSSFITGDQPVINTYSIDSEELGGDDLEFYYPISPSIAVLVGTGRDPATRQPDATATKVEVARYNRAIAQASHRQIFGLEEGVLRESLAK